MPSAPDFSPSAANAGVVTAGGLDTRQKWTVGLAGATRSASGGLLATALAVYVGRDGSPLAVGLLSAAFFFSMMVFSPVWGAVGDLTGRRRGLLVLLSAATTVLALAFALAQSVWGLVGLRGVYAAFAVGFGPLMLSLVGSMAGAARRGRAAGFFSSVVAVGDVGAQAAVGPLLVALAPAELFAVVATLSLVGTLAVARLRDPRPPNGDDPGVAAVARRVRRQLLPTPDERRTLREEGLTWLYAALAIRHAAVKGVGSLVPIFLLTQVGVSEVVMGLLLTVGSAAQVVIMPVVGRVADRGSRKRLVVAGILVSGAYGVVLAVAALPASFALRVLVAAAGFLAIAVGFSVMDIATISLVGDAVAPDREAAFVGLRSTAAGAGGVVGPLLVGGLVVAVGYVPAFAATSLLAVVAAAVVAVTLVEPDRQTGVDREASTVEVPTRSLGASWIGRHADGAAGDSPDPGERVDRDSTTEESSDG